MSAPTATDAVVELIQGSAEDVVITLTDADGNPVAALDGWSARCQVRYSPDHPTVLAEWSTANGSLVLGNSEARLVVSADMATASLAWTWRLGVWDLAMVAPSGLGSRPNRPQRGIMRLVPAVTR